MLTVLHIMKDLRGQPEAMEENNLNKKLGIQ